ncbi:MAG TPA: hypothetical protein DEO85_02895 [Maritimibacter sp.]|nr:hypothetical protein [Maritimibacter sp.]
MIEKIRHQVRASKTYKALAARRTGTVVCQLNQAGMYSCINRAAWFAHLCARDGRDMVIEWSLPAYFDPRLNVDPWTTFFEPIFPGAKKPRHPYPFAHDIYHEESFRRPDHPLEPVKYKTVRDSRTLPADRHEGHAILKKYIRHNETTQAFIDDFYDTFVDGPLIGLHMRGPGGVHGGGAQLRQMLDPDNPVPYDHYFTAADRALDETPDATLFVCSDSQEAVDRAVTRYGKSRILTYPSQRSDYGEIHSINGRRDFNDGRSFPKYKLGIDIIVEANILARSVHFVHGNSHVANNILCINPDMANTYVYAPIEADYLERARLEHERNLAHGTTGD